MLKFYNITKFQKILDPVTISFLFKILLSQESSQVIFFNIPLWIFSLIIASFILTRSGIYQSYRQKSLYNVCKKVLTAWLLINGFLISLIYFYTPLINITKINFIKWSILSLIILLIHHVLLRKLVRYIRINGGNSISILFWGDLKSMKEFQRNIIKNPWTGLKIKSWFSPIETDHQVSLTDNLKCNGGLSDLKVWLKNNNVDKLIFSNSGEKYIQTKDLLKIFGDTHIPIYFAPEWTDHTMRLNLEYLQDKVLLRLWGDNFPVIDLIIKRAFDIISSILALIILFPLFFIVSVAIVKDSKGPILYRQSRYGAKGKIFKIFKFRTMKVCEDGSMKGLKQATKNDPRISKVGSFLRAWSIDELPQLINVLMGDMSLVGPRPHAVEHNEFYRKFIPGYMQRHSIKPGITGLAQIKGYRGETRTLESMKRRIEEDLKYQSQWNLYLDLKIIINTIFKIKSDKAF